MIIPIAAGAVLLGTIMAIGRKIYQTVKGSALGKAAKSSLTGTKLTSDNLITVKLGNETWEVAPDYIGPIGIGEAADLAKSMGFELPSPALVDAIWRQADLKLLPMPRQNIVSQAVFDDQKRKIQEQVGGRDFTLLGGTFKDIVQVGGKPQLYGWHVEDSREAEFTAKTGVPLHKPFSQGPGRIIQGPSGGVHSVGFKDYSQGLRLVRRV
jgi:hypothetical protein